jgi:hypothetical protein
LLIGHQRILRFIGKLSCKSPIPNLSDFLACRLLVFYWSKTEYQSEATKMTSSLQNILTPLRSAASEMRDAALATQNDFIGDANHARDYLRAGLAQAINDIAESNAKLRATVGDVAAATRASAESMRQYEQDLGRSANQHFFGLRDRAVSNATNALDNSLHYSRDASRKMQKMAIHVTTWAARNPRLVFAVAITACCVAVVRYRRRRNALAAARKTSTRRQTKKAAPRAHAASPRQRRANGATATK